MTVAQPAGPTVVSIGDDGALNTELTPSLSDIWIDRDISWLDFNERVLAEALEERTPLLERAKFLAIFTSNLDEFFMKRIAVLRESLSPDRSALVKQLRDKLIPALRTQSRCFREDLIPALSKHGVRLRHWEELSLAQREEAPESPPPDDRSETVDGRRYGEEILRIDGKAYEPIPVIADPIRWT